MGLLSSLFGGGGGGAVGTGGAFNSASSSANATVNEDSTKNVADYSQLTDSVQSKFTADLRDVNAPVDFSILDGGAISQAFDFAANQGEIYRDLNKAVQDQLNQSNQREMSLASAVIGKASTLSAGDVTAEEYAKYGLVLALIIGTVFLARKG